RTELVDSLGQQGCHVVVLHNGRVDISDTSYGVDSSERPGQLRGACGSDSLGAIERDCSGALENADWCVNQLR
ncbi:hypothetical protein ACFVW2_36030, partial [Streptomyces sp. NPDC058171]